MGIKPGKECTRAAVQRRFEGNRLAKHFQIQAYEQALSAKPFAAKAIAQPSAVGSEKSEPVTRGGIAA